MRRTFLPLPPPLSRPIPASLGRASIAAVAAVLVLVLVPFVAGCGGGAGEEPPTRSASEVLQEHSDSLFAVRGVRGTGVTDWQEEEVIVVIVEDRRTADLDRIPARLEGHRVLVLDEEEIRRWGGI